MLAKQLDLHNHTYYSDGRYSPEQVLRQAKRARLAMVSITDHNSVSHLERERKLAHTLKINFLYGVELSVSYMGRHLHLMGYDFHPRDQRLAKIIAGIQKKRQAGIKKITRRLRAIGFDIKDEELAVLKTEYYGLSHLISILMKKPKEKNRILKEVGSSEIFAIIHYYFSPGHEAFVPEDYLPAEVALRAIKKAGGFACLAHPAFHLKPSEDRIILALKKIGLQGIEVFTPKHNWEQVVHYEILARNNKMLITAGSDYHLDIHQQDIPLSTPVGYLHHPPQIYFELANFLKKRGYILKF